MSSSCNILLGDNVYEVTATRDLLDNDKHEIKFDRGFYLLDVKQYSAKQLEGKNIKDGFWELIDVEPEIDILKPVRFKAATEEDFTTEVVRLLPNVVDWHKFQGLDDKLSYLYERLFEDYSQVWFKSSSGGDRNHVRNAREGLTIVLRDVLLARSKTETHKCRDILLEFLSDKYPFPLFKQITLFFINKYWSEGLGDLFDEFLKKNQKALEEEAYEVELHSIFRSHHETFSENLKKKIEELINNIPNYYLEHGEKYTSYWKYKWLSPLKDDPKFKDAFAEAKAKAQI